MKNKKRQHETKGRIAEYLAIAYLMLKGYRLVAHRLRTPLGEIDIVMTKKKTLIAIEVKWRSSTLNAGESIKYFQQQRINRALQWYLSRKPYWRQHDLRCDAVLISPRRRYLPKIHHIQNAWGQ